MAGPALAQQTSDSERSGSRLDRRLSLRRFQNRNRNNEDTSEEEVKETRRQQPRRLANQDKIAERRRELLQRNGVARRRKVIKTPEVNQVEAEEITKAPENVRIRITTESADEAIPVERITNNDQNIINEVLDRETEDKTPFSGQSEVRTLNTPSGFRSSNEQIVRISFKKTTEAPVEEDQEPITPLRRFKPKKGIRKGLLGRRINRPITDATTTTEIPTSTRVVLLSQASDALKALLKTANEPVETPETLNNKVEEDLDDDAEAAVLEMEEDNGHVTPAPLEERRRLRVRGRARGSIRRKQEKTGGKEEAEAPRQTVTRDRFRQFL